MYNYIQNFILVKIRIAINLLSSIFDKFNYFICSYTASKVSSWNIGSPWNPTVPERRRASNSSTAVSAHCPWNCTGFQRIFAISVGSDDGTPGSGRSLSRRDLRRRELNRNTREARHHYAERHTTRPSHSWGDSVITLPR